MNNFCKRGFVEISKYSPITDEYETLHTIRKFLPLDVAGSFLLVDSSSLDTIILNADTSSNVNGLNLELDVIDNFYYFGDSYGISVALSSSLVVIGCPFFYYSITTGSAILTGSCVDIYDIENYNSSSNKYPLYTITNSFDSTYSNSTFGEAVSIVYSDILSSSVLVVGSSTANSNLGQVYIYTQSLSGNYLHYQTLNGSVTNGYFGGSLKIDPSGSNRIVVGNKSTGSAVYVYELNDTTYQWDLNDTLIEDRNLTGSLNFIDFKPYFPGNQPSGSRYGNSVSIYGDTIIVGSPDDMYYYEWSGSNVLRNRGAVYFWKKCSEETDWFLLQKSFGNENVLESNNLGFSVSIYNDKAVATSIREVKTYCTNYILNTLFKRFNCNPDDSVIDTLGQFVIYNQLTSSNSSFWEIDSVFTKKKEYGYPYSNFGYSSAVYDRESSIMSIGSPVFIYNPEQFTSSIFNNIIYDTINGYNYIYNFNDLVNNYHIGNVFYRDGKIILSNSGSIFDNLLKNRSNLSEPMYNIEYKSNIKLYEKQVLCRIEPGEFNYSTNPTSLIPNSFDFDIDNNKYFDFTDLDLILKYINYQVNGSYNWWKYMTFTNEEQSLFNLYSVNYNISSSYTSTYNTILTSNYYGFDIDGNNKVNLNDMYILWKYFNNNLNQTELFKYVEPKSTRKTLQQIVSYIEQKIGKFGGKSIKQDFFNFNYSSSVDPTGSYLAPYITTVGLYSGADLVAVAKLGMPIKNSGELPLNILVKWDI